MFEIPWHASRRDKKPVSFVSIQMTETKDAGPEGTGHDPNPAGDSSLDPADQENPNAPLTR